MTNHVLYRFTDQHGRLLYVGMTRNPGARFDAHRHSKPWWTQVVNIALEHYPDRESVSEAERRAVVVEHPIYNTTFNPRAGWFEYWDFCPYCPRIEDNEGYAINPREAPIDMYVSVNDGRVFAEFQCSMNRRHEFFCTFGLDAPIATKLRQVWVHPDGFLELV